MSESNFTGPEIPDRHVQALAVGNVFTMMEQLGSDKDKLITYMRERLSEGSLGLEDLRVFSKQFEVIDDPELFRQILEVHDLNRIAEFEEQVHFDDWEAEIKNN